LAVLERGLKHVTEQIEPIAESDVHAIEKLKQMIHAHICNLAENPAVGAAMVFEISSLLSVTPTGRNRSDKDEFVQRRNAFFGQRDYFENLFRQVIQIGVDSGEFRAVDVPIYTKILLGSNNWVGVWYKSTGRLTGSEIAEQVVDAFLPALLKKK